MEQEKRSKVNPTQSMRDAMKKATTEMLVLFMLRQKPIRIAFLSGLNNQISGLYISCDGHILLQILLFDLYLSIWHLFMLGHRRLNFFRYFVSNDLNINYLLCNLNRYVVDISIMG